MKELNGFVQRISTGKVGLNCTSCLSSFFRAAKFMKGSGETLIEHSFSDPMYFWFASLFEKYMSADPAKGALFIMNFIFVYSC